MKNKICLLSIIILKGLRKTKKLKKPKNINYFFSKFINLIKIDIFIYIYIF